MAPLALIDLTGTEYHVSDLVLGIVTIGGILAAIMKSVAEIWKHGLKEAVKKFVDWVKFKRTRRKMLATVLDSQNTILAELRTNGGSSLKDLVLSGLKSIKHIQARVRNQDEVSKTPIFEMDARGNMTYTNAAFRELIGAEESDVMYRNYITCVRSSDRRRLQDEIQQSADNLAPIDSTAEFLYDGRGYVKIRMQATPDIDEIDGKLVVNAFFGTATIEGDHSNVPKDCPLLPELNKGES